MSGPSDTNECEWRVPGDVTVSGWDDSPAAAHHDLTSVHQSLEEQGTLCALVVLGREGQREPPAWRLVERGCRLRSPTFENGLARLVAHVGARNPRDEERSGMSPRRRVSQIGPARDLPGHHTVHERR